MKGSDPVRNEGVIMTIKHSGTVLLGILALAALSAGSLVGPVGGQKITVSSEGGVTVVHNPVKPAPPRAGPRRSSSRTT